MRAAHLEAITVMQDVHTGSLGWFAGLIFDPQGKARFTDVRQTRRLCRGKRSQDFSGASSLYNRRGRGAGSSI